MKNEMKINDEIQDIVEVINEIIDDDTTNKNIKESLEDVIQILLGDENVTVKIHNALQALEELSENKSMESFTRSAIFNIVSMLESLNGN